jgi:hypothetical protein
MKHEASPSKPNGNMKQGHDDRLKLLEMSVK